MNRILGCGVVFAIVGLAALAGCALQTHPIPFAEATSAPDDHIYALNKSEPGLLPVRVKRDVGHAMTLCPVYVLVDGTEAAVLDKGEKVTLYVKPGQHILAASAKDKITCYEQIKEMEMVVGPGRLSDFRISFDQNAVMAITPTATN